MKKILLTILCISLLGMLFAQEIPQKISYQGKLYENGSPVTGTKQMKFTIGNWTETHSVKVDNGLYSIQLGSKTAIPLGTFTNSSNVTLQVAVEGNNLSPTTDILSVPYAYKAEKAVSAENVPTKVSQLTNDKGYITNPNDADASKTNEIQTLSINGSTLSISSGNSVNLPSSSGTADNWGSQTVQTSATLTGEGTSSSKLGLAKQNASTGQVLKWNGSSWAPGSDDDSDGDSDSNNEIQTISKSGNTLTLSDGGGSVDISGGGLSLPINEDTNHLDNDIEIDHDGSSGKVLDLDIRNSNNSDEVIDAETDGNGDVISAYAKGNGDAVSATCSGNGDALYARVSGSGNAIRAKTTGSDEAAYIYIDNSSSDEDALYVKTNGTGRAAYFSGDVKISGKLEKSDGTFVMDHPLDPANKYLYHSFVESPDMMNIYNGNVILNEQGTATVEMPNWFEALNMNFRYQLTCIGGFAQVYIAEKIDDNSFKIAGGVPGLEVSWQVTGVRNDPYARENRIQVEVEKPEEEKGRYFHYKEYGQPYENSIEAIKDLDLSEK